MAQNAITCSVFGNGQLNVPAAITELQGIGYDDEVKVSLAVHDEAPMDEVSFKRFLTANGNVTIPSDLRSLLGIETGDTVHVTGIERTGESFNASDHTCSGRTDYSDDEWTDSRTSTI